MTATAPPRSSEPASSGPDASSSDSITPAQAPVSGSPPAPIGPEVALLVVTLVAALSLGRLFDDRSMLLDVALAAVGTHAVAAVMRHIGANLILSWVSHLAALTLILSWTRYPDLLTWGLPTTVTVDAARTDLADAWDAFQVVIAPTEPLPGFIVSAMIGVWIVGAVADLGAFRARLAGQALIPSAILIVFVGALGTTDKRVLTSAAWIGAAIAFLLVERVSRTPVVTEAARRRYRVRLVAGGGLVAASVLVGAVAGPLLPGLDDDPLIDPASLDSNNGTLLTLSPLVDIRGRLVNQAPVEVFRVTADEPAYWRTTALDEFDGATWGFSGTYSDAGGDLPADLPDVALNALRQEYTITGLADIWLPSAFVPVRIDQGDVKFDAESSTIIRRTSTAEPLEYAVISANPTYDVAQLLAADDDVPADIRERYTDLPADFSPIIRQQADEIVEGVTNHYEQMRKIQDFFVGNFTYDITVGQGHGANRTERFLTERRGYCEQFAGTFAAMARHLGVPARVAVGFTWGEPTGDGEFIVRGEHYHAWPEVYFAGVGWVPFEPTPGRGAPGAQAWTGRDEAQANGTPLPETTTTTIAGTDAFPALDAEIPDFQDLAPGADPSAVSTTDGGGTPAAITWLLRLAAVIGVAALVIGGWIVGVSTLRRRRRQQRRDKAATDSARVEAAWEDLVESLGLDGIVPFESETRRDYSARVGRSTPLPADRLDRVAQATDLAAFGSAGSLGTLVSVVHDDVEILEQQLTERLSRGQSVRRLADPRPLLRNWPQRLPGSP